MDNSDRLKHYCLLAEISRKWATTMDTKAAFISALNLGLLSFIWAGTRLYESIGYVKFFGSIATFISLGSLVTALFVVLPRSTLKSVFGKKVQYAGDYKPISFYGFIANHYPKGFEDKLLADTQALNEDDFLKEALEQHYTISHIVQKKDNQIAIAGNLLIWSLLLTAISIFLKLII